MNKTVLTILILAFTTICYGQTKEIKYYNNEWLEKEVSSSRGKYSQTIIKNTDGSITTEVRNLKKDELNYSRTYKGEEPFGIWKFRRSNFTEHPYELIEVDYSFDLKYAVEYCIDSVAGIKDYFVNNDSLKYIAPTIEGGLTIFQFTSNNIIYPHIARENGIMGTVNIAFTLTENGLIENIVVLKGTNILLDKEAVRVIRKLKFATPPTTRGQTKKLCLSLPISFKLM